MSTAIQSIVVNELTDKRVILNNSSFARKIAIGNNWSTIRIGMRFAMTDIGFNPAGQGNHIWFGMMSDPSALVANGPAGSTTKNFVGIRTTSGGSGWIRDTAGGASYGNTSALGISKVNTTIVSGAGGLNASRVSAQPLKRLVLIVQIEKGSPNYSVFTVGVITSIGNTVGLVDIEDMATLVGAMEIDVGSGISAVNSYLNSVIGVSGYTSGGTSFAASETPGDLNAVVLSWQRSVMPLIASEILWAKML